MPPNASATLRATSSAWNESVQSGRWLPCSSTEPMGTMTKGFLLEITSNSALVSSSRRTGLPSFADMLPSSLRDLVKVDVIGVAHGASPLGEPVDVEPLLELTIHFPHKFLGDGPVALGAVVHDPPNRGANR